MPPTVRRSIPAPLPVRSDDMQRMARMVKQVEAMLQPAPQPEPPAEEPEE